MSEPSTTVRTLQDTINVWFDHREIPYPNLALDGIKGHTTDVAIERIKRCFGWTGKNVDATIGPKFLSEFALAEKNGRLVAAKRYRSNPAQIARGLIYRARLKRYLKSLEVCPAIVMRAYAAADAISVRDYPYVWGGGHESAGSPSGGGYDCSGSVGAVVAEAGMGYRVGQDIGTSTEFESWGIAGEGKYMTIWASSDHVWIQWHIKGKVWRFDTSPHGSGGDGPKQRTGSRSTATFVPRHWPGC